MVAGGVDKEVIQINEDTIWDGSPYGTITDENGNTITNIDDTAKATTISTKIRQAEVLQTVGNFTVVQMRTVRLPQ